MKRAEFLKTGTLSVLSTILPIGIVINYDLIKKWEKILLFSEMNGFNIAQEYQCKPIINECEQYDLSLLLDKTEKILREENLGKYARYIISALRRDKETKWSLIDNNKDMELELRLVSKQFINTLDYDNDNDIISLYSPNDFTIWCINPNMPVV